VNIQAANEAIKQHKNEPSSVSASTSLEKRAPPAPTWRWDFRGKTPVRGVNLGGWLVTEVSVPLARFFSSKIRSRADQSFTIISFFLALDHSFSLHQHR
jgi:hypothetical protein